jgi:hypothetical protein
LAILILCLSLACVSDDAFFAQNIQPEIKARAIVEAGIARYTLMTEKDDISQIPAVSEYFNVALRFDPNNNHARTYKERIENFRDTRFDAALSEAYKIFELRTLTESDVHRLGVLVERSRLLKPNSIEFRNLDYRSSPHRRELVRTYQQRTTDAIKAAEQASETETREAHYTNAWNHIAKTMEVAPNDFTTRGHLNRVRQATQSLINSKLSEAEELLTRPSFNAALNHINKAAPMAKTLGKQAEEQVTGAYFQLYLTWASTLYRNRDYIAAARRIGMALDYRQDPQALEMQSLITAARENRAPTASTPLPSPSPATPVASPAELALREIDQLLQEQALAQAWRLLKDFEAAGQWPERKIDFDSRRTRIASQLRQNYQQGLRAYREERFNDAINFFTMVEKIERQYEQVAEYLHNSREKQRIIDQY